MSMKNPVTTPGIDPGTVRLVAQRFNHYATTGPNNLKIIHIKNMHLNQVLIVFRVPNFVSTSLSW